MANARKGTTSACAENTRCHGCVGRRLWNYLRVRGEYFGKYSSSGNNSELPPRARRIPCMSATLYLPSGTTSACAENTHDRVQPCETAWNYLRVRGEYSARKIQDAETAELPPRARRILQGVKYRHDNIGTTSACAENTHANRRWGLKTWNYLRVRGEYFGGVNAISISWELPPRARRIRGRTQVGTVFPVNYLRVRGEYRVSRVGVGPPRELPPRARRIRRGEY